MFGRRSEKNPFSWWASAGKHGRRVRQSLLEQPTAAGEKLVLHKPKNWVLDMNDRALLAGGGPRAMIYVAEVSDMAGNG
jgi:hypothetical protein